MTHSHHVNNLSRRTLVVQGAFGAVLEAVSVVAAVGVRVIFPRRTAAVSAVSMAVLVVAGVDFAILLFCTPATRRRVV